MKSSLFFIIGLSFSIAYANENSLENKCFTTKVCYSESKKCPIVAVILDKNMGYIVKENLEDNERDSEDKSRFLESMKTINCPLDYKAGVADKSIVDDLLKENKGTEDPEITKLIQERKKDYCENMCGLKLLKYETKNSFKNTKNYSKRTIFLSTREWIINCSSECVKKDQ